MASVKSAMSVDSRIGSRSREDSRIGSVSWEEPVATGRTESVSREDSRIGSVSREDSKAGSVSWEDSRTGSVSWEDSRTGSVSREDSRTGSVSGEDSRTGSVSREDSRTGSVSGEDSRTGSVSWEEPVATADSNDEHQSTIGSLPPTARLRLDIELAGRLARSDGTVGGSAVFTNSFGDVVRCAGPQTPPTAPPVTDEPVPLDGGFGWLVAFGAFLANLCVSGTIKSFGLISLQLQEMLHVSAAEIGVVTGILLTTGLLLCE